MLSNYLTTNRKLRLLFCIIDYVLNIFIKTPQVKKRELKPHSKILLANGAHIGDIVISTSLLPIIKSAFPDVKIGFLVGSWTELFVRNNPMIDFVHVVDHWKFNRNKKSLLKKAIIYKQTQKSALQEIKDIGYDIAIELYSYLPDMIPLLWKAKIPIRVGYTSGGYGPLLTYGLTFNQNGKHESQYQADLLKTLSIDEKSFHKQQSVIFSTSEEGEQEVIALLGVDSLNKIAYRVMHIGASSPLREWPINSWRALIKKLLAENILIVFTGIGEKERLYISNTTEGLNGCINAAGKLSLKGFVEVIRNAELIYAVETSAGHIAAAVGTPCVSIYGGITDTVRWRPIGNLSALVTKQMPCAPCHRKNGCENMTCIRDVDYFEVYEAGKGLLGSKYKSLTCQL